MRRPLLLTLAAGAALTVAGCNGTKKPTDAGDGTAQTPPEPIMTGNPPPPEPPPEEPLPNKNPPAPTPRDIISMSDPALPKWDAVPSPHPEGATNPPSPVLIVTPDGRCFKRWEGGMIPPGPDRVEAAAADAMTTQIDCPRERALGVFDAWTRAQAEDASQDAGE